MLPVLVDGCIELGDGDRCEIDGKPSAKACQARRGLAAGQSRPDVDCVWSREEIAASLESSSAWYTPQAAPVRVCSQTPQACRADSDCPRWPRGEICSWKPGFIQLAQPGSPRLDWLSAHFSALDKTGGLATDPMQRRYFMDFRWDVACPMPCQDASGRPDATCTPTIVRRCDVSKPI